MASKNLTSKSVVEFLMYRWAPTRNPECGLGREEFAKFFYHLSMVKPLLDEFDTSGRASTQKISSHVLEMLNVIAMAQGFQRISKKRGKKLLSHISSVDMEAKNLEYAKDSAEQTKAKKDILDHVKYLYQKINQTDKGKRRSESDLLSSASSSSSSLDLYSSIGSPATSRRGGDDEEEVHGRYGPGTFPDAEDLLEPYGGPAPEVIYGDGVDTSPQPRAGRSILRATDSDTRAVNVTFSSENIIHEISPRQSPGSRSSLYNDEDDDEDLEGYEEDYGREETNGRTTML